MMNTKKADRISDLIDQETGHYRYAPAFGKCRLIGCPNQATSWVCKIRGDLPEIMRATFWAGIGPGTSSPHVPYYAFSDKIPEEYQKGEFLESMNTRKILRSGCIPILGI